MRPEDRLLFACTRQQFGAAQRQIVLDLAGGASLDWASVWEVARNHGVAPLVYKNLKACPELELPPPIAAHFNQFLFQNIARKERSQQRLLKALRFLTGRDLTAMLVKGAALDLTLYEEPWYTFAHDIDLLLPLTQAELNKPPGAALLVFLDDINEQESSLQALVEYDFFAHHDISMNGLLDVDFQAIWREAELLQIGDQSAYVMAGADQFIAACIGSCRKRFFRLKSLLDIAELTRASPALDWSLVTAKAAAYHCGAIVYTAVRVADLTLGCRLPAGALAALPVSPGRRRLLDALSQWFIERSSLPRLSIYGGRQVGDRVLNPAVLLVYAALSPRQLAGRLGERLQAQLGRVGDGGWL